MDKKKPTQNTVKWGTYTEEDMEQDRSTLSRGDGKFLKLQDGRNQLRVLPARAGEKPFLVIHQHFVNTGERKVAVACPRLMARMECPVCDYIAHLAESGTVRDQAQAREMRAQTKVLCNCVDRADPDGGAKVLSLTKTTYEQMMDLLRQDGNFLDPDEGYDLAINKKGKGLDVRYTVTGSRENSALAATSEERDLLITEQPALASQAPLLDAESIHDLTAGVLSMVPARKAVTSRPQARQLPPKAAARPRPPIDIDPPDPDDPDPASDDLPY